MCAPGISDYIVVLAYHFIEGGRGTGAANSISWSRNEILTILGWKLTLLKPNLPF